MRTTSIEVYHQIKRSGLLSKLRFDVYEVLFEKGPLTQTEVTSYIHNRREQSITPRFAELEKLGVISPVGERACTKTGRVVTEWDVTDALPKVTKKEKKQDVYACKTHQEFVLQGSKCKYSQTSLFPCEVKRVIFKEVK